MTASARRQRSHVLPALRPLLLAFLLHHAAHAQQDAASYANVQGKRLLVTIANHDARGRQTQMLLMLKNFVESCEAGIDVAVVILSLQGNEDVAATFRHEHLFCMRTSAPVPVEWRLLPSNVGFELARHHRIVWQERFSEFDYFLYLEDDLDFRTHHIAQYAREYEALRGTQYVPYLRRAEYDLRNASAATRPGLYGNVLLSPEATFPLTLFYHAGSPYIAYPPYPTNSKRSAPLAYGAHVFCPAWFLAPYVSDAEWIAPTSVLVGRPMFREHFAGLWFSAYNYTLAWPLKGSPANFVAHTSHNYITRRKRPLDAKVAYPVFLDILGFTSDGRSVTPIRDTLTEPCLPKKSALVDFDVRSRGVSVSGSTCAPARRRKCLEFEQRDSSSI